MIRIKKLWKKHWLVIIVAALFLIEIIIAIFFDINIKEERAYELNNIDISELTEKEKTEVLKMLDDLNPKYLEAASTLKFINKPISSDNKTIGNITTTETIIGVNYNGDITVVVTMEDLYKTKIVLCHELLHSIITSDDETEEWFADDMSKKGVCYK